MFHSSKYGWINRKSPIWRRRRRRRRRYIVLDITVSPKVIPNPLPRLFGHTLLHSF